MIKAVLGVYIGALIFFNWMLNWLLAESVSSLLCCMDPRYLLLYILKDDWMLSSFFYIIFVSIVTFDPYRCISSFNSSSLVIVLFNLFLLFSLIELWAGWFINSWISILLCWWLSWILVFLKVLNTFEILEVQSNLSFELL